MKNIIYIAMLFFFHSATSQTVTMVDVSYGAKQGDAHVIFDGDEVIVIDAGDERLEYDSKIVSFLIKNGSYNIDEFYVSHAHKDHYGGVVDILDAGISIDKFIFSDPPRDLVDCCFDISDWERVKRIVEDSGSEMVSAKKGRTKRYKFGTMKILHAEKKTFLDGSRVDLNDMSLIMRYQYGKTRILFTGDLSDVVGEFLSSSDQMKADVLKIPHHGVNRIAPNSFFDKVNPSFALFPSPWWVEFNPRGFQSFSWVKDNGIPFCISGLSREVRIELGRKMYKVIPSTSDRSCITSEFKSKSSIDISFMAPITNILLNE